MDSKMANKKEIMIGKTARVLIALLTLAVFLTLAACDSKGQENGKGSKKTVGTLTTSTIENNNVAISATPTATPVVKPTKVVEKIKTATPVAKTPEPKAVESSVEEKLEAAKDIWDWYRARNQFFRMEKQDPAVRKLIDEKEAALLEARPNKAPSAYEISDEVEIMGILYRRPKGTPLTNAPDEPCAQEIVMLVRTLKKLDIKAEVGFAFFLKMDEKWIAKLPDLEDRLRNGARFWSAVALKENEVWQAGEYHLIYAGGTTLNCPVDISVQMYLKKQGKPAGYHGNQRGINLGWYILADE